MNYFRLSQTDFDGTIKHLQIIAIEGNKSSSIYTLYPNPTKDRIITIDLEKSSNEHTYTVYSIYGQKLKSETFPKEVQKMRIDLPTEGSTFIVEIMSGSRIIGKELIISN